MQFVKHWWGWWAWVDIWIYTLSSSLPLWKTGQYAGVLETGTYWYWDELWKDSWVNITNQTSIDKIDDSAALLKQLLPMLEPSNLQDSAGRQRIAIDYIAWTTLGNSAPAWTLMLPWQTIPVMNVSTWYAQLVQNKIDQLWTRQNELDVAFNTWALQNLAFN